MPEQSNVAQGPIPAPAGNDPQATPGSTQAPEQTGVPQASAETPKPVEPTAAPATENKSEEETTKLYRENQSLKDRLNSLEEESKRQQAMINDYVPAEEVEARERTDLEAEKQRLRQEKQELERSKILEEKLKLPEYRDLEPFRGDITGFTEEAIVKELDGARAKAEAWKAKSSGAADLPSAGGAKSPADISTDGVKNMTAQDLEKILPKSQP